MGAIGCRLLLQEKGLFWSRSQRVLIDTQELVVTESSFFIYSFTATEIAPFVEILLTNLFKALTLPGSSENEYIMKGRPFPWYTDS